jgi:hypothetical protein
MFARFKNLLLCRTVRQRRGQIRLSVCTGKPILIFVSKEGGVTEPTQRGHLSGAIRRGRGILQGTNALAYLASFVSDKEKKVL